MYAHPIKFLELLNGQVQYVVPRWQRRYCWGQSDIERLVDDLVTIAAAGSNATHYGGTLLTFPDPGAAGVVTTIRVVDGQQRLTTVSILLGCIAAELGEAGECDGWTRQIILDDRLTNPGKPSEKRRKLRLQDGDEEEYRRGLEDDSGGAGAVSQAWRIARRLVARHDVALLLRGLDRLRVVSIGLDDKEDPQQIFESLNATGRPLTESEKVKNWLLMGLPDAEQQDLHDNHWLRILYNTGARVSEVTGLQAGDLQIGLRNGRHALVTLRGKGGKIRQCPLWPRTEDILAELVRGRSDGDAVFLSRHRKPYTRFGVYRLVERCAARVPPLAAKAITPHVVRHTSACHLLQAGVDLNTIRAWLGHVSLDTTNIYAEIDLQMKAEAMALCDAGQSVPDQPWKEDKSVIAFLNAL